MGVFGKEGVANLWWSMGIGVQRAKELAGTVRTAAAAATDRVDIIVPCFHLLFLVFLSIQFDLSVSGGLSGLLAPGGEFLSISWSLGVHFLLIMAMVFRGLEVWTRIRGLKSASASGNNSHSSI
jgi:hypothetical protein